MLQDVPPPRKCMRFSHSADSHTIESSPSASFQPALSLQKQGILKFFQQNEYELLLTRYWLRIRLESIWKERFQIQRFSLKII